MCSAKNSSVRPSAVAADRAGRFAVLDSRGTQVHFFSSSGVALGRFAVEDAGMQRVIDLSFAPSGALHLIEESSGLWWRAQ